MDYPPLLPDERLLPLIQDLVPEELARVTILMSDLTYAMTKDRDTALHILNCVGSQIANHLPGEDADEFHTLLERDAGADPSIES